LLAYVLVALGVLGGGLAVVIAIWAEPILRIIYGSDLNAIHLLRLLSIAIPLDFCAAWMGTVLVSRGFDKTVMCAAGSGALCDVLLNLWLIPRFGAMGAAWATLISYLVLLVVLVTSFLIQPVLLESALASGSPNAVGTRG
jgi:O-antigen/teichoic acid export membrane protein